MSHGDLPFTSGWFLQGNTCTINCLNVAGVMQQKWNDGNWSYKPSFAVNDICWLISLYFTTDHVTRKGNWPIQQVLYLPAFFLVPPLTILTKQCMPFSWFQWLCLPDNIKALENKVLPGRATNTHSRVHFEMCWGIAQPKRNQLTESGYFWEGAISCHLVDH